jgi:hypothetical protein
MFLFLYIFIFIFILIYIFNHWLIFIKKDKIIYMFYDIELGCHYEVGSCPDVKKFTGSTALCTDCPFGDCIYCLKPSEKRLIMQAPVIRKAFSEYDTSHSMRSIAKLLNIPYTRIHTWLQERDKIEQKLQRYALTWLKRKNQKLSRNLLSRR